MNDDFTCVDPTGKLRPCFHGDLCPYGLGNHARCVNYSDEFKALQHDEFEPGVLAQVQSMCPMCFLDWAARFGGSESDDEHADDGSPHLEDVEENEDEVS